jgi:hypothetical protein
MVLCYVLIKWEYSYRSKSAHVYRGVLSFLSTHVWKYVSCCKFSDKVIACFSITGLLWFERRMVQWLKSVGSVTG